MRQLYIFPEPIGIFARIARFLVHMHQAGVRVKTIKMSSTEFKSLQVSAPSAYARGHFLIKYPHPRIYNKQITRSVAIRLVAGDRWTS